jgi:dTDP-4-dehydrorhamnose 3,5-epimerase
LYDPDDEGGVLWSDPELGIDWPEIDPALISDKDRSYPPLAEIPAERLPGYSK